MTERFIGIAGIAVILAIGVLLSTNRRAIRPRIVLAAFALQAGLAFLVLRTDWGVRAIASMSRGVVNLLGYAGEGTSFIFGPMASPEIGGNSFALAALTVIIFFASLVSILYYLGIMQLIVRWIGGAIRLVTGVTRVESLVPPPTSSSARANRRFVIRPYLASLTQAQLFTVMAVGMAGVAGTILAAYAAVLGSEALPFLLAASFMAAPGGLLMAKIMMPDEPGELVEPPLLGDGVGDGEERPANVIMAAAQGAQTGVKLAVAVGAMVLAFVALVALANGILGGIGDLLVDVAIRLGNPFNAAATEFLANLSFQGLLGYIFQPIMFLVGVPWEEAGRAGGLFGTKLVLNEFVAFIDLGANGGLTPRSAAIVTFSLCGFANFSSIAIQMAVTGGLAPNQRPMIARLGIRALIAGSLGNLMSAALAGLLLPY